MTTSEQTEKLKQEFLRVSTLSKGILEQSDYWEGLMQGWHFRHSYALDRVHAKDVNSKKLISDIRFSINDELKFWEIHIDIWTELFWRNASELGLDYPRKDLIQEVLKRGRFAGVGQAMHTRYEWTRLVQSGLLQDRYSADELAQMNIIIATDEAKRLQLLTKCLRQKRVAASDYLRYGDAIAYFTRASLFDDVAGTLLEQHFNEAEIRTLDAIWK